MAIINLPVELIVRVIRNLDDISDLLNLSNSCKYLFNLIRELRQRNNPAATVTKRSQPIHDQFLAFSIGSEHSSLYNLPKFKDINCDLHHKCPEHEEYDCEVSLWLAVQRDNDCPAEASDDECVYHRMFCLGSAKHQVFRILRMIGMKLYKPECLTKALMDAGNFCNSSELETAIVDNTFLHIVCFEFIDCEVSLDWLLQVSKHFCTKLVELRLQNIILCVENEGGDKKKEAARQNVDFPNLKVLRLTGDRAFRLSDRIFMKVFYYSTCDAIEILDLTASRMTFHRAIARRYYSNMDAEHIISKPSNYVMTFALIMVYLKRSCNTIRRLILNKTGVTATQLAELLDEPSLAHMNIEVIGCPELTDSSLAPLMRNHDFSRIHRSPLR